MSSNHDHHTSCCGGGSCSTSAEEKKGECCHSSDPSRRDFLFMTAGAMAAVGAGSVVWPFIDQMNPAADTKAMSTTEVPIDSIQEGQAVTVMWRGKPVFIRHRTAKEIEEAKAVDVSSLRDKQADSDRFKTRPEWLVVVGVCTHLGCVPQGQKTGENKGEFDGWFCPCHGSAYDSSGRIRKGPAPKNLEVPTYSFISDTVIRIG